MQRLFAFGFTAANANSFCVEIMAPIYSFPSEWKRICAALLRGYKEQRRKELGYKRLGWGRVRDEIMVEHDRYSDDGKLIERDERLKRQHLEAMDKGTLLSDPIFAFVDAFIRRLDIQDTGNNVLSDFRQWLDRRAIIEVSRLYQTNSQRLDPTELAWPFSHFWETRYFRSDSIENTWFRSLVLRFDRASEPVAKITVAYLPEVIEDVVEADYRDIVFLTGFLIPFTFSRRMAFLDAPKDVIVADQFLVKLVRAEYKGDRFLGYADGELITGGKPYIGDHLGWLDFPSAVLNPSTSASDHVRRYYPLDAEETASLKRVEKEANPDYEDEQPDFFKTYRWRMNLWSASEHAEILDKIFKENYKGYIY